MQNRFESTPYPRISNSFRPNNYDENTIVIPKPGIHLPSINEINSEMRFPSHFHLDDFITSGVHYNLPPPHHEQDYTNNVQTPLVEDIKKPTNQIILRKEVMPNQMSLQKMQPVQYNQTEEFYTKKANGDNQAYSYYQAQYNPNELQVYNNINPDPRYLIQYQVPINSMIPQISEVMNSPYMEKSYFQSQNNHFNYINFRIIEDHSRIILDPVELSFIPADQWTKGKISLENLKKDFFCARSSKCLRFEYKLWNALQITKHYPYLFKEIGVRWVAKSFIMVHRDIFGHLLQVTRPSAALFSSCGMFMTHGFREIMLSEVRNSIDPREISSIDESIVRLFVHKANDFNEDSGSADIVKIKWNNESRKKAGKW